MTDVDASAVGIFLFMAALMIFFIATVWPRGDKRWSPGKIMIVAFLAAVAWNFTAAAIAPGNDPLALTGIGIAAVVFVVGLVSKAVEIGVRSGRDD